MAKSIVNHVANELRQRMATMHVGERLPPVRQLMASFDVSQLTMQKALGQLKQEGLLTTSVGRGTFVGSNLQLPDEPRNILVLTREQQTDRSDEVARGLHRALLKRDWRAAVLSYSDFAQATDLVRNASGFDACVVHPRLETLPLELLATLRSRSRAVVVEGYSVEGVDVDGVAVDWNAAVATGLRHLLDLGHRRIGLMALDRPVRAFSAVASQFRLLHDWAALDSPVDPVMLVPSNGDTDTYTGIASRLKAQTDDRGRQAFSALLMFVGTYHGRPLLKALRSAAPGISVAMLGFTDLEIEHGNQLTTVGQSTANVTEAVAQTIERRWAEPAAPHVSRYLAPELIERSSTQEHKD